MKVDLKDMTKVVCWVATSAELMDTSSATRNTKGYEIIFVYMRASRSYGHYNGFTDNK